MIRRIIIIGEHHPYMGSLPDGYYTYPPSFEEQNDPEYLLKADEVRRIATELGVEDFEIITP